VVTGPIDSDTISSIKTALESTNGTVNLDLSQTTGLSSIASSAFSECTKLTSISIPSSVTSIENGAFYRCTGLISVTIPSSVTSIENSAFRRCTALTSIIIPNSVTVIKTTAFYECTKLTNITIPSSVTEIGNTAFSYCTKLTSIDVDSANSNFSSVDGVLFDKNKTSLLCYPAGKTNEEYEVISSVTSLGNYAFNGCAELKRLTIPGNVTSIGKDVFMGSVKLESISIDSTNPNYSSADGVLFNKGKTTLMWYPVGKIATLYSIPDTVTKISMYAFMDCINLTSVTIPSSVTRIESYAISGCTNLTSVTLNVATGKSWYITNNYSYTGGTAITITPTDTSNNAIYLNSEHVSKYWYQASN